MRDMSEEKVLEELPGKEVMQDSPNVLNWMFQLLHANIQDVKSEVRRLTDRQDQMQKEMMAMQKEMVARQDEIGKKLNEQIDGMYQTLDKKIGEIYQTLDKKIDGLYKIIITALITAGITLGAQIINMVISLKK